MEPLLFTLSFLSPKTEMNLRLPDRSIWHIWPSFTDVIISMLLIFIFFIFAQFLVNSQVVDVIKMRERQKEMEAAFFNSEDEELSQAMQEKKITIETKGNFQRFRFSDQILFETRMADLKEPGKEALDKVGRIFLDTKYRYYSDDKGNKLPRYKGIHIEGHADIRPISTPEYPSNWELSTARAIAVLKFFLERFDEFRKEPELLSAAGYGEHHPVPEHPEEEFDIHRRIELVLEYNVGEE